MSTETSTPPLRATPIADDARDFTVRQFAREFEAGADLATAASRLRGALPAHQHRFVEEVESWFAGNEPRQGAPRIAAVLDAARRHGARPERAFVAYQRAARELRPVLGAALGGANTFGSYLASLLAVLAIVVTVYAIFVMPQFKTLFDLFGAPLPQFTRFVMGNSWVLLPVFALAFAGVVYFFQSLRTLKSKLRDLQPVRPALRWIPGFGDWGARYDAGLWMRYQAIFIDAGMNADDARTCATHFTGEPAAAGLVVRLLASAAQLGRLREELAEQLARADEDALAGFERPRNAAVLFIRSLIYLLVSAFIVAMYLPIFKLGALV